LIVLFAFVGLLPRYLQAKEKSEIPEIDGIYTDPDYPDIKVRVFVHKEKPARSINSTLVCSPDPESDAVVHPAGWKLPQTWTYSLNLSSAPASVNGASLPTIAKNGFDDWISASGKSVSFSRNADTLIDRQANDFKNIIAWGRTSGNALAVTYIRYYPDTGRVVDIDTIMNKKFAWKWANSNTCADPGAYDAENILTHEQGHWLGLDDEYNAGLYGNATMYGYGAKGEVKKTTLTKGDKVGASQIYQ